MSLFSVSTLSAVGFTFASLLLGARGLSRRAGDVLAGDEKKRRHDSKKERLLKLRETEQGPRKVEPADGINGRNTCQSVASTIANVSCSDEKIRRIG